MTTPLEKVRALNYDHHRRMSKDYADKVRKGTAKASDEQDDQSYRMLLAEVPKCYRILELGSAQGTQWSLLRQWLIPGGEICGIDLYEPYVRIARSRGLPIALGYVEDMGMYADEFFGLVCSRHVMEHLGDLPRGIDEILRVTVSGGYIAQVTPDLLLDNEPAHLNVMDLGDWIMQWESTRQVKILSAQSRPFNGGESHLVVQKL